MIKIVKLVNSYYNTYLNNASKQNIVYVKYLLAK